MQALIIMDFLLSLSSQAREKLGGISSMNKAVTYMDQVISEEDVKTPIPLHFRHGIH